jgi:Ca2+-binding EF-hand superfamily protein
MTNTICLQPLGLSSCSPHSFFKNLLTSLQASTNYKEAFALFDKRGNGRVALESLGDLLRACGQNPTLAEIKDLERNVGGDCKMPLRKQ